MPTNFYDEDFKKSIVSLYQSGKSQTSLSKEYGVSLSAINKWVKRYSEIKTEDGDIFTAKQIKELQKRLTSFGPVILAIVKRGEKWHYLRILIELF